MLISLFETIFWYSSPTGFSSLADLAILGMKMGVVSPMAVRLGITVRLELELDSEPRHSIFCCRALLVLVPAR